MATNPPVGNGRREGAVRHRSQVFNLHNNRRVRRDAETGRFMAMKGGPQAVQRRPEGEIEWPMQ